MSWTDHPELSRITAPADAPYALLRQDCRFENYSIMHVYGVEPEAVARGRLATLPDAPVRITLSAYGTHPSDVLEEPCLVVSDAVRNAFEQAGVDNVQYQAVELQLEYSDQLRRGYWLANVVGLVACVDPTRSQWEGGDPEVGRLLQFEIDPQRALGLSLFRLAEEPRLVVVSARVRRALERAGTRGVVFQAPAAYDGYAIDSSRGTHGSEAEEG